MCHLGKVGVPFTDAAASREGSGGGGAELLSLHVEHVSDDCDADASRSANGDDSARVVVLRPAVNISAGLATRSSTMWRSASRSPRFDSTRLKLICVTTPK